MRFVIFENGIRKEIVSGFLRFCKYTFLILEKGYKQKIVSGFFGIL